MRQMNYLLVQTIIPSSHPINQDMAMQTMHWQQVWTEPLLQFSLRSLDNDNGGGKGGLRLAWAVCFVGRSLFPGLNPMFVELE